MVEPPSWFTTFKTQRLLTLIAMLAAYVGMLVLAVLIFQGVAGSGVLGNQPDDENAARSEVITIPGYNQDCTKRPAPNVLNFCVTTWGCQPGPNNPGGRCGLSAFSTGGLTLCVVSTNGERIYAATGLYTKYLMHWGLTCVDGSNTCISIPQTYAWSNCDVYWPSFVQLLNSGQSALVFNNTFQISFVSDSDSTLLGNMCGFCIERELYTFALAIIVAFCGLAFFIDALSLLRGGAAEDATIQLLPLRFVREEIAESTWWCKEYVNLITFNMVVFASMPPWQLFQELLFAESIALSSTTGYVTRSIDLLAMQLAVASACVSSCSIIFWYLSSLYTISMKGPVEKLGDCTYSPFLFFFEVCSVPLSIVAIVVSFKQSEGVIWYKYVPLVWKTAMTAFSFSFLYTRNPFIHRSKKMVLFMFEDCLGCDIYKQNESEPAGISLREKFIPSGSESVN